MKIYTRSELAIMAWRSQETIYLMDQARAKYDSPMPAVAPGATQNYMPDHITPDAWINRIEERLGPIVHKIEEADGKDGVDFRKLTGAEAMAYLKALGQEF